MSGGTVGVDPGAHGAIALLDGNGCLVEVRDMPSVVLKINGKNRTRIASSQLAALLRAWAPEQAFVERVGAMPGQGTASMFAFGYAAGLAEGVLAALGVPTTFVTPTEWKRAMRVAGDKDVCRQRAMQLFPTMAPAFARKKDDGRAEAALVASFGQLLTAGPSRRGVAA